MPEAPDWIDEPIVDPAAPARTARRAAGRRTGGGEPGQGESEPPPWVRWALRAGAVVTVVSGALFTMAAHRTDGEAAAMSAVTVVVVTMVLIGLSRPGMGYRRSRPRPAPECVVVPAELDRAALELLARARRAVTDVRGSRAYRLGLLDTAACDVVLPERLWEIARLLRAHTGLRAEQAGAYTALARLRAEQAATLAAPGEPRAQHPAAEDPAQELAAVLDAQRDALASSVAFTARRVRELEDYARSVRAADLALHAHDRQRGNDRYRDLLASAHDTDEVRRLTAHATTLTATLHQSLATDSLATGPVTTGPVTTGPGERRPR
ncbi:hypothetical protein MF672_007660 [Actinomadura sp. ATCC 31491]|uniref:Integral membrane protein n=1 Tax=Actinomadura luzonensis TaxID=2805427 RepID=A0ABT0FN03_9ACTN|nr:hypothetical protein [Actinomadura luzonensis]MCK2213666.1 hypothetical protein [Actinomadura luzonensis]